jgi:hypothetical protein
MPTLKILDVKCLKTSDSDGVDEPMIQIKGSSLEYLIHPEIRAGETWKIDESFPFTRAAVIELWDIDEREGAPENDDIIGVHVVRASDGNQPEKKVSFREIGGEYELTYAVE